MNPADSVPGGPLSLPVDVLTFGESLGSLRTVGSLRQGGPMRLHLAGAESNVAIGLARLGHRVRWAGRLGADDVGEFLLAELRREGVLTDCVQRDAGRPTGLMFLERRTADVMRAHYHRRGSAGSALGLADVETALRAGARLLHLTGITPALSESALAAVRESLQVARSSGTPVCFDANYRSKLWSRAQARSVLAPLAAKASIVVASEEELDLLVPPSDAPAGEHDVVRQLLASGVQEVVIKRAERGAAAFTAAGTFEQPPVVVTAVDTVGAGDAFCAGYLSALLDGEDIRGRLGRGALMGAFAVSTAGDWEGLPDRSELELLQGQQPGSTQR